MRDISLSLFVLVQTFSPTVTECDILIVSDRTDDHHELSTESEFFSVDRKYDRFPNNDWSDRPIWQYEDPSNGIESAIQFESNQGMGWVLFLNFDGVRQCVLHSLSLSLSPFTLVDSDDVIL